ncbi:MAG: MBL fold metallo-hydrolase [Beduini sp.]|mgnify:FL=1|uniref:MBL fold metallo-hydrolase n=1 Tax=Beduini sp. TaxID=1922300 RepID=UPI0011C764FC
MKFIITGSGGCVALPRPLCQCAVCKEAREKGLPYARHGASLYLEDIHLLVDTPEDIMVALNEHDIQAIDHIFYSHLDIDHTFGMRVIEHLRLNWLDLSIGKGCTNPIKLYASQGVMADLNAIMTRLGSVFDYYESLNLIKRQVVQGSIMLQDIKVTFVPVDEKDQVTIFIFEKAGKKLIYAPCDVKPWPNDSRFGQADYLIMGNTVLGDVLKDGIVLAEDNMLKRELFTLEEIMNIKQQHQIRQVIMTHIEEDWGKSYDDYLELAKHYENIEFAYDGMVIEL